LHLLVPSIPINEQYRSATLLTFLLPALVQVLQEKAPRFFVPMCLPLVYPTPPHMNSPGTRLICNSLKVKDILPENVKNKFFNQCLSVAVWGLLLSSLPVLRREDMHSKVHPWTECVLGSFLLQELYTIRKALPNNTTIYALPVPVLHRFCFLLFHRFPASVRKQNQRSCLYKLLPPQLLIDNGLQCESKFTSLTQKLMRRYLTLDSHNSQVKIQGPLTICEVMSRAIIRNYFASARHNVLHCHDNAMPTQC